MAQALSPLTLRILWAGAMGTVGAVLFGALLWIGADAAGVSYKTDGDEVIGLREVVTTLVIVGLVCSALALTLAGVERGNRWFAALSIAGLAISVVSPATVADDTATLVTLIAHHMIGGVLIAVPLLRAMDPQQQHLAEANQYR